MINRTVLRPIILCLLSSLFPLIDMPLGAQTRTNVSTSEMDPRGTVDLTLCGQNLDNYGLFSEAQRRKAGYTKVDHEQKGAALLRRFVAKKCDVIALQELLGSTPESAELALRSLATALYQATNRRFAPVLGKSNDKSLRNAFLVAEDRATLLAYSSYENVELPKITPEQKQRFFSRGPLEIQLRVKGQDHSGSRNVAVITFHFKSKSVKGGYDPTGLEWEPFRMEMSEGLRRLVELRHRRNLATGKGILVLMGDRNSHYDSASAKILEGTLQLKHFQEEAVCRLSKRGVPLCQANTVLPQKLFSVLTTDPDTRNQPGTFQYRQTYSWLDDLIMPAESLPFAWARDGVSGDYDSGVYYQYNQASDHAMTYVRLNW